MICMLDVDGVVGNFAEHSEEFFQVKIEPRKLLPQNSGMIEILKNNSAICRKFILGIKLYWYVPDLFHVLHKNFEKIYILSKPLTPAYEEARFEWVKTNLGERYSKNFIFNVKKKEIFACSSSILIDDMKSNCRNFIHNGGYALHWFEENFDEMLDSIFKLRYKMGQNLMQREIARLENIK